MVFSTGSIRSRSILPGSILPRSISSAQSLLRQQGSVLLHAFKWLVLACTLEVSLGFCPFSPVEFARKSVRVVVACFFPA